LAVITVMLRLAAVIPRKIAAEVVVTVC